MTHAPRSMTCTDPLSPAHKRVSTAWLAVVYEAWLVVVYEAWLVVV